MGLGERSLFGMGLSQSSWWGSSSSGMSLGQGSLWRSGSSGMGSSPGTGSNLLMRMELDSIDIGDDQSSDKGSESHEDF